MAKKRAAKKKPAKRRKAKKASAAPIPARVRALVTYRCGEPGDHSKAPPAAIGKLMVEHLGAHGRIVEGAEYRNLHPQLVAALIKVDAVQGA